MLELAAIWIAAYLIGGIPFGYLVARGRGVNILAQGSGNIGATNVGRVLGFRFGILVFVLDFAKGALPVAGAMLVHHLHPIEPGEWLRDDWLQQGLVEVGAGLLAFLGHLLPIYLGFRGGKGVATGAGVVAVLAWLPALSAFVTWVLLASAFRYVSLASVGAALVLCIVQLFLTSANVNDPHNWFCVLAGVLILVRHRSNLVRLLKGTENRLPPSALLDQTAKAMHVLAIGLWFGGAVFFSWMTLGVFTNFDRLTHAKQHPSWLPLPDKFKKVDDHIDGAKEQAFRLAGSVVGPMFPRYFLLQIVCSLIALVPAAAWAWSAPGKVHGLRRSLLLTALLLVVANGFLDRKVHGLQGPLHKTADAYLRIPASDPAANQALEAMKAARKEFFTWHGISMLLNYATILLVTAGMVLTVSLPVPRDTTNE